MGGGRGGVGRHVDIGGVAAKALVVSLALGAATAVVPTLPDGYSVVHAHVVMRHGQRTRLIKTPAQEFGQNDGVVVSA